MYTYCNVPPPQQAMRRNSNGLSPREHLWLFKFKVQIIEIAGSQKCFLSSGQLVAAGIVTITVLGRIFRATKRYTVCLPGGQDNYPTGDTYTSVKIS